MFEILVKQTKKNPPKTQTKKKQNSARFKEGVHCIVGSTLRFLLSKLPESKTFHCVSYVVYIIFVLYSSPDIVILNPRNDGKLGQMLYFDGHLL